MPYQPRHDQHTGLLHFKASAPLQGYWRYFPSPDLEPYVEHFWTIEWDLPEPSLRETLPYPSAHIILEPGVAQLAGVHTTKFSRMLQGRSRVLGTKFRPGGLRPFVDRPVSEFTNQLLELSDVFGASATGLDARALASTDHHAAIAVVEEFLRQLEPKPDASLPRVRAITERIAADRGVRQVEQLAEEFGLTPRTLQRLFSNHVGVSPKWMIRRYRLQEAAEAAASAESMDWARVATELGYADQAHFIRDFKQLVGQTPASYFRTLSTSDTHA